MRQVKSSICAVVGLACAISAAAMDIPSPDVTVVLDFKGAHSSQAVQEMERESTLIMKTSGLRIGWTLRGETMGQSYNDLVVLTFRGSCAFDPAPPIYDELGPYASTHISNGEVQPFGVVDCDRVVNSVRGVMSGGDYARAEMLVGRALGRVVSHELVHMLTRSREHGHEGVQKPALTGRQLIAATLPLSALDVDRLRQERRTH